MHAVFGAAGAREGPPIVTPLAVVYRAPRSAECEERAFVLTAVGIPALVEHDGQSFVVRVDAALADEARSQLERYAAESRTHAAPAPAKLHPYAWVGCALYGATLIFVAYAVGGGYWRLDSFELGTLDAARVQQGEWWRALTALTLHASGPHLATNLGAGVWFGYLAGRQLGPGIAWLLAVLGAGTANFLEAVLGPGAHRAVGASTAVFAMLGALAAYSWRDRYRLRERWARRWGPLIAGVVLLGWTGSQGEGTDVVAHVAGFIAGVLLGAAAALPASRRLLAHCPQWLVGIATLAAVALAWTLALRS